MLLFAPLHQELPDLIGRHTGEVDLHRDREDAIGWKPGSTLRNAC
jgi:hypothetical protein